MELFLPVLVLALIFAVHIVWIVALVLLDLWAFWLAMGGGRKLTRGLWR